MWNYFNVSRGCKWSRREGYLDLSGCSAASISKYLLNVDNEFWMQIFGQLLQYSWFLDACQFKVSKCRMSSCWVHSLFLVLAQPREQWDLVIHICMKCHLLPSLRTNTICYVNQNKTPAAAHLGTHLSWAHLKLTAVIKALIRLTNFFVVN